VDAADRFRFVLVGPKEPGNVGASARALKNMGLRRLVVVPESTPAERLLGEGARRMARGAEDLLASAEIAPDLDRALEGCGLAVATTARLRDRIRHRSLPELLEVLDGLSRETQVAFLFGREDHGLSNPEVDRCQAVVTVPTSPEHPSLNLAQTVLLVAYELTRPARRLPAGEADPPASAEDRAALFAQMEELLLEVGYLNPQNPRHIQSELRRLLERARLTDRDVALLRGMWSQLGWAARRGGER
jgi:TrmH family RNA methyltransferase